MGRSAGRKRTREQVTGGQSAARFASNYAEDFIFSSLGRKPDVIRLMSLNFKSCLL